MAARRSWSDRALAWERWLRVRSRRLKTHAYGRLTWPVIALALVYQLITILREYDFPDTVFWSQGLGAEAVPAIVVVGALSVVYVSLTYMAAHRISTRRTQLLELEDFLKALVVNFHQKSRIPITSLTGHVYRRRKLIAGEWLERIAVFKLDTRIAATGIDWRPGKGAIGLAWTERAPYTVDLGSLHKLYAEGEQAFADAASGDRMGLSLDEYRDSRHYWAVYVAPLLGPEGDLIGVATVSSTQRNSASKLESASHAPGIDEPLTPIESLVGRR